MAESAQVSISFESKIMEVPILVAKPEFGMTQETPASIPFPMKMERTVCTGITLKLDVPTIESSIE
jgi:hypothetical protein